MIKMHCPNCNKDTNTERHMRDDLCLECMRCRPRYDAQVAIKTNLSEYYDGVTLSGEELIQACKNVGINLSCGACAEVFYTGMTQSKHTCRGRTT